MNLFNLFFYSLLVYLAGGIGQAFAPARLKPRIIVCSSAVGAVLLTLVSLRVLLTGTPLTRSVPLSFPWGEVLFTIDALSAFFILIISLIGCAAACYAGGYLKPYIETGRPVGSHLFFFNILIVFMLLVTVLQNALAFLIAWEIMSLSSLFLVGFEHEKREVFDAAIHYLVAMHVGVIFLISAFVILYVHTGSLSFPAFSIFLKSGAAPVSLLFLFFFIGFGTKAGFFPFHVWLPKAHPAAPAHISGLMSAVMIKTGIYGICRILFLMGPVPEGLAYVVLGISLVSALLGIIYAVAQRDIKRFLAYSSIENIGIIGIGIGIGMLGLAHDIPAMAAFGFGGALFHLFNHSVFKALLFFGTGNVYQYTHHRDMEKMGGLTHAMPVTAALMLAGSLAICALPPFNGFIGEFLLYFSMIKGILSPHAMIKTASILSIGALAFVGGVAMIAFTKMFSMVFLGLPKHANAHPPTREAKPIMLVIMGFLAAEALVIGLFPQLISGLLEQPLHLLGAQPALFADYCSGILSNISYALFVFFLLLGTIFALRWSLLKHKPVTEHKTWDCGYQAPSPRMQYSGSSYSRFFLILFRPLLDSRFYITQSSDSLFPTRWRLKTHFTDIFETYVIAPVSKGILRSTRLLHWIQRGSTQQYILYGLIFLITAILWILGTSQ
ncbi:MAG: proton-conducting transporter membrane subunit [Candidatus Omnitrophota bacterium]